MSIKSSSTLVEVPGVTSAVEHLQDLALRMQGDQYNFSESDISTIDIIIEAIYELQHESGKIHEKLETETIESSVLRHTLQFLPGIIKSEIQEAVNSARQSNADELNRLQDNLEKINTNIIYLKNRHEELESENAVLHPERDRVRELHDDIITQLNHRMAEKASKQIVLNETRDKLRETNQKIVDLEEGIIQLKEDLIQERADARMEKKRLKKAVYDTTMKTREQKEVNMTKKKELDVLLHEVYETETQLDEIRKSIRRFEASKARLETQEQMLVKHLERETRQNEELKQKGIELEKSLEDQEAAFKQLKAELNNRTKELKKDIKVQEKNIKKGSKQKKELEKILTDKVKVRREDEERVKEQNAILQELKNELALKAEDAARLRQENMDIEQRIEELRETHEAIVATFQKQIAEMRAQLAKERKERMELQGKRDSVQREVDDFKLETHRYLTQTNRKISEGKKQHEQLTQEGTQLQQQIRNDELMINKLEEQLTTAKTDLESYEVQRKNEIKQMEEDIVIMNEKLKETEGLIEERMPSYVELKQYYEERIEAYDKLRKNVVALKNRKSGLEDGMNHATRELGKLQAPTEKLRAQLEERRLESMAQLKQYSTERTDIEKQIYTTGSKLRTAMEENHQFMKSIDNLENWILSLEKEIIDTDQLTNDLESQLCSLKESLSTEWDKDNDVQKIFAARDQALVEDLGRLLSTTEKREETISSITKRLDEELVVLGQFLDNVAKRRPKESSKGHRPVKSAKGCLSARSNIHSPRSQSSAKSIHKSGTQQASDISNKMVSANESVSSAKAGQSKDVNNKENEDGQFSSSPLPSITPYPVLSPIPSSSPKAEMH